MLSPEAFTYDEAQALEDLATEVELGEYASDRIVYEVGIGPYQMEHAMLHAQAVLRPREAEEK